MLAKACEQPAQLGVLLLHRLVSPVSLLLSQAKPSRVEWLLLPPPPAARCFSAPFGARAPKLRSRATMQKAQDVQHQTSDDATCTRHSHLGSACSCRFAHPFANGAQHRNRQLGVLHTFRPLDWPPLNDLLALASTCTHTCRFRWARVLVFGLPFGFGFEFGFEFLAAGRESTL